LVKLFKTGGNAVSLNIDLKAVKGPIDLEGPLEELVASVRVNIERKRSKY